MARSFRKPWYTDGYKGNRGKQFYKRWANKVIRNTAAYEIIADGKSYRKFFDSWSIMDFRWFANLAEEDEPWKVNRK